MVVLAILGDLAFGVVEEEFDEEDVALPHKGNLVAVGGEDRALLRTSVGERYEGTVAHIVDVIDGCVGASVDALRLRSYEDVLFIGTHHVPVNAAYLGLPLRVVGIEEYGYLLSRTEGIGHDALAVFDHGVLVTILQGIDAIHAAGRILPVGDVAQTQFLACPQRQGREGKEEDEEVFHNEQ